VAIVSTEICTRVNQGLTSEQFNKFNQLVDWSAKAYKIVSKKAVLRVKAKNDVLLAKFLVIAGMQEMGIANGVIDEYVGQERLASRAGEWIRRRCLYDKPFEKRVQHVKRMIA